MEREVTRCQSSFLWRNLVLLMRETSGTSDILDAADVDSGSYPTWHVRALEYKWAFTGSGRTCQESIRIDLLG